MSRLLAVLTAVVLLVAVVSCSSSDDDADVTTTDGDEVSTTTTPTDTEADDTTTTTEEGDDDRNLPSGLDQAVESLDTTFDLDAQAEACVISAVADDPSLADVSSDQVETDPEVFVTVFGILRDCMGEDQLADFLVTQMAGPASGLTDEQLQCVAEGFVALDDETWAAIILAGQDPTFEADVQTQLAVAELFGDCDVDLTSLSG